MDSCDEQKISAELNPLRDMMEMKRRKENKK
jgi:hypothetical protein